MTKGTNFALGVAALSVAGTIVFNTISERIPVGSQVFAGHIYLLTDKTANTTFFIDTMSGLTLRSDGRLELGSGGIVFNSTRNPRPCLDLGTKSLHCSERAAMSAPTANTNQYIAAATNPFSLGTGVALGAVSLIVCEDVPNTMNADITVSTSATSSGTILVRNDVLLFTGAVIIVNTGSVIEIPIGSFLTVVTTSGSNTTRQSPDCDLVPYIVEV